VAGFFSPVRQGMKDVPAQAWCLIQSGSMPARIGDTVLYGGVAKWQCTSLQRWGSWFDSNIRLHPSFS
jgi:hypothetical protein